MVVRASCPVVRRLLHARHFRQGRRASCVSGDARPAAQVSRLVRSKFLRIRHIRKVERLASFRQRDPRIPQASIMFPLLGVVCFLRQRCAPGGRFPCGLALGSHVVLFHFPVPHGYGRAVDCIAQHILSTTRRRFQAPQLLPNATYWCFLDRPVSSSGVPFDSCERSSRAFAVCSLPSRSRSHLPHAASDRLRDSSVPSCDAFATSCTPCIILCPSSLV